MIDTFFQKLGLTGNEKTIYLFLLKHGHVIASIISKRLFIKRVTTYASLMSLERRGLVTSYKKNDVTFFEAVPPKVILNICSEMLAESIALRNEAATIMPTLEKMAEEQKNPIVDIKGKIKYYEGLNAVKNLIDETIETKNTEQLCFGLNNFHVEHMADEWKKYTQKRVSNGIKVRSLQPDTDAAIKYKQRDGSELRITKLVPHDIYPTKCELNIIGDTIALFTAYGEQPAGMKIHNKEMAQALRSLFELAWIAADYEGQI